MARIRTIKPDFFKHGDLYLTEERTSLPIRIAFAGLWGVSDREGRFKWKPMDLKPDILPHDKVDFADVLRALEEDGFVVRYEVDGKEYGYIPSFSEHQHINSKEAVSKIPAPPINSGESTGTPINSNGEGKGREGKESISSNKDDDSDLVERAYELWNELAEEFENLPKARAAEGPTRKRLRTRLKAEGIEGFQKALAGIRASPWHRNDDRWGGMNLGWLTKAENFEKMQMLADAPKPAGTDPPQQESAASRALRQAEARGL